MTRYNPTREQHEAEVEAEFRNCLTLQPVIEARDSITNVIREFVHEERHKSFAFLG
jgi:hypothetical protein